MSIALETVRYVLLCESYRGAKYESLAGMIKESCDFLIQYFPNPPGFEVRCFADRKSFSATAGREIEPGWMGSPVKGEINFIVLSLETEEETGGRMAFHSHIVHEVAHIYINHYTLKKWDMTHSLPAWLEEGLCQWFEWKFRSAFYGDMDFAERMARVYRESVNKGLNIPLSEMVEDLCLLDDPKKYCYGPRARYAYGKAFLAVAQHKEKCGKDRFFEELPLHTARRDIEIESLFYD